MQVTFSTLETIRVNLRIPTVCSQCIMSMQSLLSQHGLRRKLHCLLTCMYVCAHESHCVCMNAFL